MSTGADEILTYWLVPAEPALSYFRSLIRELAERFDGPVFGPHVTLYTTNSDKENPAAVLQRTVAKCNTHRLSIAGIDFSDEFTKTLFVQFRPDAALTALSNNLRSASMDQSEFQLNPHLSLIYKTMSTAPKQEIVNFLSLPFDQVSFDSAKAVISPARIESRADVEAWKVVAAENFIG
jgi:2'-5' RNA ligase